MRIAGGLLILVSAVGGVNALNKHMYIASEKGYLIGATLFLVGLGLVMCMAAGSGGKS